MARLRIFSLLLSVCASSTLCAETTELEPNDTLGTATAISFTTALTADGRFLTGAGVGNIVVSGDNDWWSIALTEGDRLTVYVENLETEVDLRMHDPAENYLFRVDGGGSDGGSVGDDLLGYLEASVSGTYFLQIRPETSGTGVYQIHGIIARNANLESDASFRNDTQASADQLTIIGSTGLKEAVIAGRVIAPQNSAFDEDYFKLGILNSGNTLDLQLSLPANSTLIPRLRVFGPSGEISDNDGESEDTQFQATLTETGTYYALVQSNGEWIHEEKRYRWLGNMTWANASAAATASGGQVLHLKDEATASWTMDTFSGVHAWLGLTDEAEEGTWVWGDGTVLSATYSNWAGGEPNSSSYDNVFRHSNGFWYDDRATSSRATVVETPAIGLDPAGPGPEATYLLEMTVNDTVPPLPAPPPQLPEDGQSTENFLTSLTQVFDENITNTEAATSGNVRVYHHDGNAYLWIAGTFNWESAQSEATARGGKVVSVNDEAEATFIYQQFARWGDIWLGLTHNSGNNLQWEDGGSSTYTRWATNEPNTSSYTQAYMSKDNGFWYDYPTGSTRGLVVELETPEDTDEDGIPDLLDAYPLSSSNVFDLREAGSDGLFDTDDDQRYHLHVTGSGTNFSLGIVDGPLPSGLYRYQITSELEDEAGNAISLYEHTFTVSLPFAPGEGFVQEGTAWNDRRDFAIALVPVADPDVPAILTAQGEGSLSPSGDEDWWSFDLEEGQKLAIHSQGFGISTRVDLYYPDGSHWTYDRYNGPEQDAFLSGLTVSETGTYTVRVTRYTGSWHSPYRIWITLLEGESLETDAEYANNNNTGADALSTAIDGTRRTAGIAGDIMRFHAATFDTDRFLVGILNAGNTIDMSLSLPAHSTLLPRLQLFGPSGEITDSDGLVDNATFSANITETGTYYAVVSNNREWVRNDLRYRWLGSLSHDAARAQADLAGGRLIQFKDRDTAKWAGQTITGIHLWIGLSDTLAEGTWLWDDGTDSASTYTNWASGEPNSASYDVAFRHENGFWYDDTQTRSRHAILELDDPGAADAGPGPRATYLLELEINDIVAPLALAPSGLPANGETSDAFRTAFTQNFDEPIANNPDALADNVIVYHHNGSAYIWLGGTYNWADAQDAATTLGGQIVSINDSAEQAFVDQNFGRFGNFWIGLTHALGNDLAWEDASGSTFTAWAGSEPNSSSYVHAYLNSANGFWYDLPPASTSGLLVELPSAADTDSDGWPDVVDPWPSRPHNVFDLREAGVDGLFDTADDIRYQLGISGGGTAFSLNIIDGPLPSGSYRYRVSDILEDANSNNLATTEHFFTVELPFQPSDGFVQEGTTWNNRYNYAVELPLSADPLVPAFKTAKGEGSLSPGDDIDWWKVTLEAGEKVALYSEGFGVSTRIDLYDETVSHLTYDRYNGAENDAYLSGYTVPSTGLYYIRITRYTGSWHRPYKIWLTALNGVPMETDSENSNDSTSNADPVIELINGTALTGKIGGHILRQYGGAFDEDYYDLGLFNAGNVIELDLDLPEHSTLLPRLRLFGPSGEVTDDDGEMDDTLFTATLSETGRYYARVESDRRWIRQGRQYQWMGAMTYTNAAAAAADAGGSILQLKDAATAAWSLEAISGVHLWLGLTDEASEGIHVWADGTLLSQTYSNWASGEPNSSGYDYVFRHENGFWYDDYEGRSRQTVIESDATGLPDSGPGASASYLLTVSIIDTVPPTPLPPAGLPANGGSTSAFVTQFTQNFDEDITNPTVVLSGNEIVYTHNGHAYVWRSGSFSWAEAQAEAADLGGYLVSVGDEDEQAFIDKYFSRFGNFWLGLTHSLGSNAQWQDGSAAVYAAWANGEPNTSSYPHAYLRASDGWWIDAPASTTLSVLVEIPNPIDSDGDGIPDNLDAYPAAATNVFDLREAGSDGLFDTADDILYQLRVSGSGVTVSVTITDGPLLSGSYRFRIADLLEDSAGNLTEVYEHFFSVELPFTPTAGFLQEDNQPNNRSRYALELPLESDTALPNFHTAQAEGALSPANDLDWWSVHLESGQKIAIHSRGFGLSTRIDLYHPDGSHWTYSRWEGSESDAFLSGLTIPETGTYSIRVTRYTGNWERPYQLWVTVLTDTALETDAEYANDSTSGADVLNLTVDGQVRTGKIAGDSLRFYENRFDTDTYNLGILNAGNTVDLTVSLPGHSILLPTVRLVGPSGDVTDLDGLATDSSFSGTVVETGTHYAVIASKPEWIRDGLRYIADGYRTYDAARSIADTNGWRLLQLKTVDQSDWSLKEIGGVHVWLGLDDIVDPGIWRWDDGTALETTFSKWASGEPNSSSYHYAFRHVNGFWYDDYSGRSRYVVYESDATGLPDAGPGPRATYQLEAVIMDTVAPEITYSNLPDNQATTDGLLSQINLNADEPIYLPTPPAGSERIWTHGGHFYVHLNSDLTYAVALQQASDLGGQLVSINNVEEQTFLDLTFSRYGAFWLGLIHEDAATGTWEDGTSLSFTNWQSGEPNTASYQNTYLLTGTGQWADSPASSSRRAIVEIDQPDQDMDGIPDNLDLYDTDPLNVFDLREAGYDGVFDTEDDRIYRLVVTGSGTGRNLQILDGPLPNGLYRFTATDRIEDANGNTVSFHQRVFTVSIPGECFSMEGPGSGLQRLATELSLAEDPGGSGMFIARGAGLFNSGYDWWKVYLEAGESVVAALDTTSGSSSTTIRIYNASLNQLTSDSNSGAGGNALTAPLMITTSGNYFIRINGTSGVNYFLRLNATQSGINESDKNYSNESRSTANLVTYETIGEDSRAVFSGTIMGDEGSETDEDTFDLGLIDAGQSLFLTTYLPCGSQLQPLTQLRFEDGSVVDPTDTSIDGIVQYNLETSGNYFVLVQATAGEGAFGQYTMETRLRSQTSFPDLVPSLTATPAAINAGEVLDLSWSVENSGSVTTNEGAWQDWVILSRDTTLGNSDDLLLGSFDQTADLIPTESYTHSASPSLPVGISGQHYLFLVVDASASVFEFDGEGNNIVQRSLIISPVPSADLIVELGDTPIASLAGSILNLDWTVTNNGEGTTGNGLLNGLVDTWEDRIVLSLNGILGDSDDILLDTVPHNGELLTGGSYTVSQPLQLPSGVAGLVSIFVVTDAANSVFEDPDSTANADSAVIQLATNPYSDFVPGQPTVLDPNLTALETTINWTVENAPHATAGVSGITWTDRVYLSPDETFNPAGDVLLGELSVREGVPIGSSYSRSLPVTLPDLVQASVWVYIVVDATDKVDEFVFETDNQSPALELFLPVRQLQTIDFPDLTPAHVIDLVATASSGLPVLFSATPSRVAEIQNNRLIARSGGIATVTASQAGDDDYFPASASQTLRIPPIIGDLTFSGGSLVDGTRLVNKQVVISAEILDTVGISQVAFYLTPPGSATEELVSIDNNGNNGWSVPLDLLAYDEGEAGLRVVATATDSAVTETIRTVVFAPQQQLLILLNQTDLIEGGSIDGVITLESIRSVDTNISITSNRSTRIYTSPVVIPAGQLSVSFITQGLQNNAIEGEKSARLTAAAVGTFPDDASITLVDDDAPELLISINRTSISENEGSGAAIGTVTRNPANTQALQIYLESSDISELSIPASVVLLPGEASTTFPISAIDDEVIDGTQSVSISGALRLSEGAPDLSTGTSPLIQVLDNEGPRLLLSFEREWLLEDGSVLATIVREDELIDNALPVTLTVSDPAALNLPADLSFPAGHSQITFPVNGISNGVSDGKRYIDITASAEGLAASRGRLLLTDQPQSDLLIESVSAGSSVVSETFFEVNYQLRNDGAVASGPGIVNRVYLSRDDSLDRNDTVLREFVLNTPLGLGGSLGRTETGRAPLATGDYYIFVETDVLKSEAEIYEDNNIRMLDHIIQVRPAYTATIESSENVYASGDVVTFSGSAWNQGTKVPNVLVNIHIRLNNTERVISAFTDFKGDFVVTWQPLAREFGEYEVGAVHPGVSDAATQDSFSIIILHSGFANALLEMDEQSSINVAGKLTNPTEIELTGLNIEPPVLPEGFVLNLPTIPDSIAPGTSLDVVLTALAETGFTGFVETHLTVTTDQGVGLDIPLYFDVLPLLPMLEVEPELLRAAVLRDTQKTVDFIITNTGGVASGPISLILPAVPWIKAASPGGLSSIEPGGEERVSLLLSPGSGVELSAYEGTIILSPESGYDSALKFNFRVVTDLTGDLAVDVVDEYFYYTEERPKVAGADVVVRDAISLEVIAESTTPASGELLFTALPEGWYTIEVTGPRHAPTQQTIYLNAGEVSRFQAFISRQMVTYSWTVEEIEIEDRYRITIESEFETNVPVPVVTVSPATLDVEDLTALGQAKIVNFTIENHGLIAAEQGAIDFGDHPFYEIVPLVEDIGHIPARSSVTIPVTVRKIGEFDEFGNPRFLIQTQAAQGQAINTTLTVKASEPASVPCGFSGRVEWTYICGLIKVPKFTLIPASGVDGNCGGSGGGSIGGSGGGGSGFGGGGGFGGYYGGGGSGGAPSRSIRTIPTVSPQISYNQPAPSECPCFDVEDSCLSGEAKFDISSIASAITRALSAATPPWITIQDVETTVTASGELCLCCVDGLMGIDGQGSITASITGTAIVGFSGGFEVEADSPQFTDVNASVSAFAGARLTLSGSVSLQATQECRGEADACVSGTVSLNAAAGIELDGSASATFTDPVTGTEIGYSGTARGALLLTGSVSATASGCLSGDVKFSACASIGTEATLSLVLKATGYPDKTIGGSVPNLPSYKAGDCGSDPSGSAFVTAAAAPSSDDPISFTMPGSEFIIPDDQIVEDVFEDASGAGGVCAKVRMRIDQEAVMTRTAFRATLDLENNAETPMRNVGFDLEILDEAGNEASDRFNVRVTDLNNLAGIDGTGEVAVNGSGGAQWTLIPRDTAALTQETVYTIGGIIQYTQDGTVFNIPVSPAWITVRPDAALYLSYFHQRDVLSDDPHTDVIEPAIPYNLGVLVENRGAGDARNLTITSGQPEIVDNEKGLLIDFKIIATEIAGENVSPSLTANFGTIPAGQSKVGTWYLTSSLQGLFLNYEATFEHIDSFGDSRLSLIKEVSIHETIRQIRSLQEDDGLPDFLVNDIDDDNDYPDTIYFSSGGTAPVAVVSIATVSQAGTSPNHVYNLSAPMGIEWEYLRISNPAPETHRLTSVTRSDGLSIPVGVNTWTTDRTFIGLGQPPVREDIFHLVDEDSTGEYELVFTPVDLDTTPPSSSVVALPATSNSIIAVSWESSEANSIFDVFVSVNDGPFEPWVQATDVTSAIYSGLPGYHYAFYSIATDQAGNQEDKPATTEASTVVQTGVNQPPEFTPVGSFSVIEGSTFTGSVSAVDPDGLSLNIRYSIQSDNPNIWIDSRTGLIRLETNEGDGGRVVSATVTARDGGVPQQGATLPLSINILGNNAAPRVPAVGRRSVEVFQILDYTVPASDPDVPLQALTFAFVGAVPEGMSINPGSGRIIWSTSAENAGQTYPVAVSVTDSGSPVQSTTVDFDIAVSEIPEPNIVFLTSSNENLALGDGVGIDTSEPDQPTSTFLRIRNTGTAGLNIGSVYLDGINDAAFRLDLTGMAFALAPGQTTSLIVTMLPGTGRERTTLFVESDDPDTGLFNVQLIGQGNRSPFMERLVLTTPYESLLDIPFSQILASASDGDGDPLSVKRGQPTSREEGGLTWLVESLEYVPPAGFSGIDRFTVGVEDDRGAATTGDVFVVTGKPTVMADQPTTMVLERADADLVVGIFGHPGQTYVIEQSGALSGWLGLDALTIGPSGAAGYLHENLSTDKSFYRLRLSDENLPPTSDPLVFTTAHGVPLLLSPEQMTAAASDPENDPLSVREIAVPSSRGTVALQPDGSVLYTPSGGFTGLDQFTAAIGDFFNDVLTPVTIIVGPDLAATNIQTRATVLRETPEGTVRIGITGEPGSTFAVQVSVDLITWTTIGSVTIAADGTAVYSNDTLGDLSIGFFRLQ